MYDGNTIRGFDGTDVATVHVPAPANGSTSRQWANAQHIVRACNAHHELVAALRDLSDAVATDRSVDSIPGLYQYVAKARAALAKVKA